MSKFLLVDYIVGLVGEKYNNTQSSMTRACSSYKTRKCDHFDGTNNSERAVNLAAANISLVIRNLFLEYAKQEYNYGSSDSAEGELRLLVDTLYSEVTSCNEAVIAECMECDASLAKFGDDFDMKRAINRFASAMVEILWVHVVIKASKTISIDSLYCAFMTVCTIRNFARINGVLEMFARVRLMKAPVAKKKVAGKKPASKEKTQEVVLCEASEDIDDNDVNF
jgi:hypothetical protein